MYSKSKGIFPPFAKKKKILNANSYFATKTISNNHYHRTMHLMQPFCCEKKPYSYDF